MGLRVGIDLTSVGTVEAALRDHAERYLERVYTEAEVSECRTPAGVDAERLASRFAVKEAVMKVLRPSEHDAVPWNTIEVRRTQAGVIEIELTGAALALAEAAGLEGLTASLTHEADVAAAVAVAEAEVAE